MQFKDIKIGETYAFRIERKDEVQSVQVTSKSQTISGRKGKDSYRTVSGWAHVNGERVSIDKLSDTSLLGIASEYADCIRQAAERQAVVEDLAKRRVAARLAYALKLKGLGIEVEWQVSGPEMRAAKEENREPVKSPAGYGDEIRIEVPDWPS